MPLSHREVKRGATEQAKAEALEQARAESLEARAAVEAARAEARAAMEQMCKMEEMEEISARQASPETATAKTARESTLSMIGPGPPIWEEEARAAGSKAAVGGVDRSAEMAAAMEAHQALQMAVPGIAAPPVSLRRAAADPVYAAIKGVDMDESGLCMGRSDSSELSV